MQAIHTTHDTRLVDRGDFEVEQCRNCNTTDIVRLAAPCNQDDGNNPLTRKPYTPEEARAMHQGGLPALRREMQRKAKECPQCEGAEGYFLDDGSVGPDGDNWFPCETCDGTGHL